MKNVKTLLKKAASLLLTAALCGSMLAAVPAAYADEPEPTPTPTATPEGPDEKGADGSDMDGQEPGIAPMDAFPEHTGGSY